MVSEQGMGELDGKVALVTGAGSGIGEATARALTAAGAKVLVADLNAAQAARVAADLGPERATSCTVDVTDPDACVAMVQTVLDAFGRLDIAVNNAGIGGGTAADGDPFPVDAWRRVLSVNLDGVYYSLRAEAPVMLEQGAGAIVNTASVLGIVGLAGSPAYVASKHGVVGLTRSFALALAARGVRVNAVAPGVIDTPLSSVDPAARDKVAAMHPMGRMGEAHEVAELVRFLASDRSAFCTGAVFSVDGGYAAQ